MKILFVCTANTCRSPMCEAYFNALASDAGVREALCAESAGLSVWGASGASRFAADALAPYKTDIEKHVTRPFTRGMAERADLIVALTRGHRAGILALAPDAADKTRLLTDFLPVTPGSADVADPKGGDIGLYDGCFAVMKLALDALFKQLKSDINK